MCVCVCVILCTFSLFLPFLCLIGSDIYRQLTPAMLSKSPKRLVWKLRPDNKCMTTERNARHISHNVIPQPDPGTDEL